MFQIPTDVVNRVMAMSNGRCVYCGADLKNSQNYNIDSILPNSIGLSKNADIRNLALACRKCNMKKGNKIYSPQEFAATFASDEQKHGYSVFYSEWSEAHSAQTTNYFSRS